MKRALQALGAMLLMVLPLVAAAAQTGRAPEWPRSVVRDYASVPSWAKANRLEMRWVQRDEILEVSTATAKVALRVDSREAIVNGVAVWLNAPVAKINGTLHVSSLDLKKTLLPLLVPARNTAGKKVVSVCIDPGHGGRDPGHQAGYTQEKKHTLLLAKELRDILTRAGIKTSITRGTDRFVELPDRTAYANRRGADLFLSLHYNAAVTSKATVKGAEVYCLTPAGADSTNAQRGGGGDWQPGNRNDERNVLLAYHVHKAVTRGLGMEDRGVRRARFAVLRDATMPAVLVEGGFMSHPAEGKRITTAEFRGQLARAIADGVLAYKRQVER